MAVVATDGHAGPSPKALDLGRPHFAPAERPRLADIPAGGVARHFRLVDHNPLVPAGGTLPRGGNGNDLAVAGDCLYVSSRSNNQGALILDISNPSESTVIGEIPPPEPPPSGRTLSTADISAIDSENLFVRQVWNTAEPFDGNKMELYDTSNCETPEKVSEIPLPDVPHEHFIWQGGSPHRVVLFVTFSSASRTDLFPAPPRDIDLRVYDITDKRDPSGPIALWSLQRFGVPAAEPPDLLANAGHGQPNHLHAVGVLPDLSRILAAHRLAGFYLLDSTPLASMLGGGPACDPEPNVPDTTTVNPDACIKKLHPDPSVRLDYHPPWGQSHTHSAHKVPGRPYAVVTDEPTGGCPWSWVWIVNIDDTFGFEEDTALFIPIGPAGTKYRGDLFPHVEGVFKIPETIVERCEATRKRIPADSGASFNAHKSLVFENLMFISWIAGGVRAIDISNPGVPFEAGFFFNKPVERTEAGEVNPELGIRNHPILKDGLLYFLDGDSGVYVLEYTGPRKDEIPREGLFTQQQIQVPGRQP